MENNKIENNQKNLDEFYKEVHSEAVEWRKQKYKEIISKENPSEYEKWMIQWWIKNNLEF